MITFVSNSIKQRSKIMHINNLENVRAGEEGAKRARFKDKPHIEELYLTWSSPSNNDDELIDRSVNDAEVLAGLAPHHNLKMLTISGFSGLKFPGWMNFPYSLQNLKKLYFQNCNACQQLPALGMFPSLRILQIDGMNSVKSLDQEFYHFYPRRVIENGDIHPGLSVFHSLVELSVIDMSNLETWVAPHNSYNSFRSLKKLVLSGCLRLKSIPLSSFSSLERLELHNTNDEAVKLILASNGVQRPTSLESVSIQYSPKLEYFPVLLLPNDIGIQSLEIAHCPNFQGFRILDNDEFHAQVSPDTGFTTSISSSCSLKLFDCPALTSVPDLREWTSLTELWIEDCDKLKESFSYSLASLPSLQTLYVDRFIDLLPRE